MTHPLPDKAVEAGARGIAEAAHLMLDRTKDVLPSDMVFAEACLSALAAEGLCVVRVDRSDVHRQRGKNALADHLCATQMTDGFCCPRNDEGRMSAPQKCVHMAKGEHRDCCARAEGFVKAIESRGCKIVWMHDRAMIAAAREG